jgi:membrane protease YdiL (CAAX protease family)
LYPDKYSYRYDTGDAVIELDPTSGRSEVVIPCTISPANTPDRLPAVAWRAGVDLKARLGLDLKRPGRDALHGVGLAALIGIPGLGLYLLSHALGYSLTVVASSLTDTWWRIPVSILAAVENGFLEEILVVGYLLTRLEHLRVRWWVAILFSALLRGSYHLYQGYGGFVGNALMGVIFALYFLRYRRLWPLVIAHSLIDIVVFVAYPLLHGSVSWLP